MDAGTMVEAPPAPSPSGDAPTLCLIVGRERLFRELLAGLLAMRSGIRVVAHAGVVDGPRACQVHRCDLLILVARPADDDAFGVTREFIATNPAGRVLAVTDADPPFAPPGWLADRLLAVVDTTKPLGALWSVLDAAMPTGRPLRATARATASLSRLRRRLSGQPLSRREADIFAFIGHGLTTREIAERVELSENTVRTHRKRIAAKLGTTGANLTRWAILANQNGIAAEALK